MQLPGAISERQFLQHRASSRAHASSSRAILRPKAVAHQLDATDGLHVKPRKVAIFVEPSPFSHISGMKNRFECLIKGLREAGDEVTVFTPDPNPPPQYHGAKVVNVLGFRLPFYNSPTLLLSIGLSVRVFWNLLTSRPDVIHCSTPGIIVFAAILYSKLLSIPLVLSYHTHVPEYIPKYTWAGLVQPMWSIIRFCSKMADLTLVTSQVMKKELSKNQCKEERIDVWLRGVDTDQFHPKYRNDEMRARMTDGEPHRPLLVYVGRLGAEKNLKVLRHVLDGIPNARLAFVGDGPERRELEQYYKNHPVKFMGMMKGEELSSAYASADIFMMPSESETLGFVVLEAMASGLPCVCVKAGGLIDIMTQPGTTGFLYESGDYDCMVDITRSLVEDTTLRKAIGTAARKDVELWGWTAATRQLRESQYPRAIKFKIAKRRFGFLALRVWAGRRLQDLWATLMAVISAIINAFDYARAYRT